MRANLKKPFRLVTGRGEEDVQALLARIDIYSESIRGTFFEGTRTRTVEIPPVALAKLFGRKAAVSGLLPARTVCWCESTEGQAIVIAVPARKIRVTVNTGSDKETLMIPHPPLLFAGSGSQYWIFALRWVHVTAASVLYHAPFPNVHAEGRICRGDVVFPTATPDTIERTFKLFVESEFNEHLVDGKSQIYPESVLKMWRALQGARRYPTHDLVATESTVGSVLGLPGGGRQTPRREAHDEAA